VGLLPAVEAGLLEAKLLARARNAIDRFDAILDGLDHVRLIHAGICPRHVYAGDSSITGIIDWGDAMAGEPAFDFGRLLHAGVRSGGIGRGRSLVAAALSSYGDAPWLTGPRDPKLLFYAAMFALSAMEAEFASGAPSPPFWTSNGAALRTILDVLDTEAGAPREDVGQSAASAFVLRHGRTAASEVEGKQREPDEGQGEGREH
jgi:Phosphotransferase enzyme family